MSSYKHNVLHVLLSGDLNPMAMNLVTYVAMFDVDDI
jgi:hypothetical protein